MLPFQQMRLRAADALLIRQMSRRIGSLDAIIQHLPRVALARHPSLLTNVDLPAPEKSRYPRYSPEQSPQQSRPGRYLLSQLKVQEALRSTQPMISAADNR